MSIGIWQVVLVLLIVLIVFGAGKLPKVMGDVASGVKNFRKGMRDDEDGEDTTPTKTLGQETSSSSKHSESKDETVKS